MTEKRVGKRGGEEQKEMTKEIENG